MFGVLRNDGGCIMPIDMRINLHFLIAFHQLASRKRVKHDAAFAIGCNAAMLIAFKCPCPDVVGLGVRISFYRLDVFIAVYAERSSNVICNTAAAV